MEKDDTTYLPVWVWIGRQKSNSGEGGEAPRAACRVAALSPEHQERIAADLAEARRRLEERGIRVTSEESGNERPDICFDDLIGNSGAKALLKDCIDALLGYSATEDAYPAAGDTLIPGSVLLTGGKGSGKTCALLAAISYATGLAALTDTGLAVVNAGCLTKRSLYTGLSKCLEEALDSAFSSEKAVIVYADRIDELLADDHHTAAFQPVLDKLEGADDARGWLFIATAQHPESIDRAVRDRIAQFEAHCPGPAYAGASRDSQTEPEEG